jgi:uncharacterized membrane protein YgdD (TMEM256/DUF423 family)
MKGKLFWKFGALNICSAIIIQGAGSHNYSWEQDRKNILNMSAQLHTTNSIGIMLCSLKPTNLATLSALLFTTGIFMFSGIAYYRAFKNDKSYNYLMPTGGTTMILGWLVLALL